MLPGAASARSTPALPLGIARRARAPVDGRRTTRRLLIPGGSGDDVAPAVALGQVADARESLAEREARVRRTGRGLELRAR